MDLIHLLRDLVSWEPRKMLRERAQGIMERMMDEAAHIEIGGGAKSA